MRPTQSEAQAPANGFTRFDLLVTLATIALVAGVLHPVWGNNQPSRSLVCMDNLRRLQAAWLLYAEDNLGKLPGNYHGGFLPTPTGAERPWASGWLDWTTSVDNTNTVYLTSARYAGLGPYLGGEITLHRCPTDEYLAPAQAGRSWAARVRSYSMNCYVGEGNQATGPFDTTYPIIKRLSEFKFLSPQQTFVFTEEHPDSMNDPLLFVSMNTPQWTDFPGSFHEGSAWFTFADGHQERHTWRSPTTVRPVTMSSYLNMIPIPAGDPDLAWVRTRTAAR